MGELARSPSRGVYGFWVLAFGEPGNDSNESRSCRLTTLADLFPEARGSEHAGRTVSGLTADSRKVRPGSVFVALPGTKADGAAFIPQALAAGAMAIVGEAERPATLNAAVAYLRVADAAPRAGADGGAVLPAPARDHRRGHRHQRQDARSPTSRARSSPRSATEPRRSAPSASSSPTARVYGSLTTPDPVALHETLAELAGEGVTHLAIEASSHGLDQHRLDGVRLEGGGLHQSRPRPPRLSPAPRGLSRGQAAAVRRTCCRRAAPRSSTPTASMAERVIAAAADARPARAHRRTGRRQPDALERARARERLRAAPASSARGGQELRDPPAAARRLPGRRTRWSPPASPSRAGERRRPRSLPRCRALKGVKGRLEIGRRGRAARSSSSTTPTSPTRWRTCSTRCGPSPRAGSSACSAAAATATRASGRSWARSRPSWPTSSSSPTTIRAARTRPRSAPRSWPAAPGAREIGDRAEAIRAGGRACCGAGDVLLVAGKGHETGQIVGDRDACRSRTTTAVRGGARGARSHEPSRSGPRTSWSPPRPARRSAGA